MSYSLASRYSPIFKLMGNPYTLIILDYLFENRTPISAEALTTIAKTTKSTISSICEELYDLNILSRDFNGSDPVYEANESTHGNFIKRIIEYID